MKFALHRGAPGRRVPGATSAATCWRSAAAGYYAWRSRPPSARAAAPGGAGGEDPRRCTRRTAASTAARASSRVWRPGARRVCVNTVAKLMKERQIRAKTRRKFVPQTTDSDHDQPVADNVLDRQFDADAAGPEVGGGHHVHPDRRGLAVPGRRDRPVLAGGSSAGRWPTTCEAELVVRRPGDGRRPAAARRAACCTTATAAASTPASDYQHLLASARDHVQHEPPGRLLGQRGDGELLRHAEEGAGPPRATTPRASRRGRRSSSTSRCSTIAQRLHSSLGYVSPETFEASLN